MVTSYLLAKNSYPASTTYLSNTKLNELNILSLIIDFLRNVQQSLK